MAAHEIDLQLGNRAALDASIREGAEAGVDAVYGGFALRGAGNLPCGLTQPHARIGREDERLRLAGVVGENLEGEGAAVECDR